MQVSFTLAIQKKRGILGTIWWGLKSPNSEDVSTGGSIEEFKLSFKTIIIALIAVLINSASYAEEKIARIGTMGDYTPFCIKTVEENISNQSR